jgi:carboxyl-terminal processing protease
MKVRAFFYCLFFSLFTTLLAKPPQLASGDVRGVMDQLFDYHIDKKEMTPLVLERSLKIYIKQFDPTFAYLLQEEALPFLYPDEKSLRKMMSDYEKDRFTTFFMLNQKIQDSIIRARGWRQTWEQNPKKLIADALKVSITKEKDEKPASSLSALKERHYNRFIQYISFQLQELKFDNSETHAGKIVALCEKQIASMENEYLGENIGGNAMSVSDQEHFVVLRTLKALAHSLDAHTAYFSPEEAYSMKVQLEKGMSGIGVVLKEGIEGIVIQDILKGGPAQNSGQIKKGDIIVEVDGKSVTQYPFQQVLEIMKGKEGSHTTLGIIRYCENIPQLIRVELVRSKIALTDKRVDIESEPYGDGILGKITLHSFYEGEDGLCSEKDLKNAIDQLKSQGPLYGLVLDMRDNSGGFLSQAVKVCGLFISSGVVVISKYSDGSFKYYRTVDGNRYFDGPLVVLISRGSASAAEIVAQALKDYGVAVVVGDEQTYGKGTIQHQTVTSDGSDSFFKVTIGRYYTVSGKSTQIDGVKADILVPSGLNFEPIGEAFLEYPLPPDWVASAYQDSLEDIELFARKWFQKYYLPTLQTKETLWEGLIPTLRSNSVRRQEQNKNYQVFLKEVKNKLQPIETSNHGSNDLQMEEAVNIVKDMIFLTHTAATP